MKILKESELIINKDGTIYHLNLRPGQVADDVILVGDPGRVGKISKYFDKVELKIQNRELITHTGYIGNKRLSVISTGMGTDNIDIVMNELDALVNIDFENRIVKENLTKLNIVRLGTSGAIQADIPINSYVVSTYGIGLDGMLHYYFCENTINKEMTAAFIEHTKWDDSLPVPYFVACSEQLARKIGRGMIKGFTATAPGFYGPQGRVLRVPLQFPYLNDKLMEFRYKNERIVNFEMETSALYGLGNLLGHNMLTVCAVIANRVLNTYSKDHQKTIDKLIQIVLEKITVS